MEFKGTRTVITGGANGIGRALAFEITRRGGKVFLLDLNPQALKETGGQLSCPWYVCDVTNEAHLTSCVHEIQQEHGPIDMWISGAGVLSSDPTHAASANNDMWTRAWDVHVMAHVYAARSLLPTMLDRGRGYLVNIASAAGLLCQIGDAAYSATKHAAVSFAQSLAISHGDQGISVSVVCPQYVSTPLLGYDNDHVSDETGLLSSKDAAILICDGLEQQDFLILTHPEVAEYTQGKAQNPEKWIKGMQRLRDKQYDEDGILKIGQLHRLI